MPFGAETDTQHDFLSGGAMGGLMLDHDWSASALGPISDWPQSLKSIAGLVLASPLPMIVLWGPELIQIYNDAYAVICGPKHPQALGQPTRECWPEVWAFNAPIYTAVLAGEARSFAGQQLVIERNGKPEEAWFDLTYSPVCDDAGAAAGVLVTVAETTGKVHAERRLASQVEPQRRLFEQVPGFVAILRGPDHVFEYVNNAYDVMAGTRGFVGRTVRDAFPELDGTGLFEALDHVYATGEPYVVRDVPLSLQRTPEGDPDALFLSFTYQAITDENDCVTGIFVQGQDDTETHAAIAALQATEERLRQLNADLEREVIQRTQARGRSWQVIPDLMGALNSQGYFETSNPAWQTVLGWSEAEVADTSIFELLHPDDVETTRAGFDLTQQGHPAIRFPNRYRCKSGDYRWISWIGVPEDGFVYCTGRDITEEKLREFELERAQQQLRQSQKLEAMGQLTGGVAHDFNNLLTPIMGSLDMLQRRGLGGEREQRMIQGALQSAERAKVLIQRLLAFARRQPLQPHAVDVASLVFGMGDLVASTSGPQIRVEFDVADGLPAAIADPNQLEMAILNLAVNARDAMRNGGTLTISAASEHVEEGHRANIEPGRYVRLSIADSGAGMDEETLARAIEPFFSTKGVGQGTGLGLSMVHGLASQLGGALGLSSKPGLGTTADLWLPVSDQAATTGESVADQTAEAKARGTVLLVDDEVLIRMSTADMLADLGYEVVEAHSAEAALELIDDGLRMDILITDHLMPGMTGADLAWVVQEKWPDTPVLIVSGYADTDEIAPGLPRLTKPFRQADLAASLRKFETV